MASTNVRTSILSGITMTAGAGNVTTTFTTGLSTGYGANLSVRLTNGATGPTIAGQVTVQFANDAAGTLPVTVYTLSGLTSNNGVQGWSIQVPMGIGEVIIISGSNTGQNVTIDADISVTTGI